MLDNVKKTLKDKSTIYVIGIDDNTSILQKMGYELYVADYDPQIWKDYRRELRSMKLKRPKGLFAMCISDYTELKPDAYKRLRDGWVFDDDNFPKYTKMNVNVIIKDTSKVPNAKIDDIVLEAQGPKAFIINTKDAKKILEGAENTILVYQPHIWVKDFSVRRWLNKRKFKTKTIGDYLYAHQA